MRTLFKTLCLLFCLASMPAHAAQILGNPIYSISTNVAASSVILKASAGYLNGFSATSAGTAGNVLFFDSATIPADGTVTPILCYALAATQTAGASWLTYPLPFNNGIVISFSSASSCFTKTASTTAFFNAQVQ